MRPKLDQCCQIDLADPAVRAILDGDFGFDRLVWRYAGDVIATADLAWTRAEMRLQILTRTPSAALDQIVHLVSTRPRFGGLRYWFATPEGTSGAKHRVRTLLLAPNETRWLSRRRLRALYLSQCITRPAGLGVASLRLMSDLFGEFASARRGRRLAMRRSRRRARLRERALCRASGAGLTPDLAAANTPPPSAHHDAGGASVVHVTYTRAEDAAA
jgi:hypothetical protein